MNFSTYFRSIYVLWLNLHYFASSPILTMMRLHIMVYTYSDVLDTPASDHDGDL